MAAVSTLRHLSNGSGISLGSGGLGRLPGFSGDRGRVFDKVPLAMATNDHVHVNSSASFFSAWHLRNIRQRRLGPPPASIRCLSLNTPGLLTWR